MLKMAAIVSGGGSNLQAIIDAIAAGQVTNTEIALVISTNDRAYALERAKNHGIDAVVLAKKDFEKPEQREDELLEHLASRNITLLALCGSLMILSKKFIDDFDGVIINVHPALLPNFGGKGLYGLKVHEAVLAAGAKETGATVHYVEDGIDTGRIIKQKKVAVLDGDTPEALQRRVMEEAEWQILPEVIAMFAERGDKL